jgi:hypothetical protein
VQSRRRAQLQQGFHSGKPPVGAARVSHGVAEPSKGVGERAAGKQACEPGTEKMGRGGRRRRGPQQPPAEGCRRRRLATAPSAGRVSIPTGTSTARCTKRPSLSR